MDSSPQDEGVEGIQFEELGPSELGTKEYWDKTYVEELKSFKEDGVVDEGWFGEDSGLRIVRWMSTNPLVKKDAKIVDVGCGNGALLLDLAQEGFTNLLGLDYSAKAVELAKAIVSKQEVTIEFAVCDVLSGDIKQDAFDVALDKGTYDAISLHHDNAREKRLQYIERVWKMLKTRGLLVLTSCNWTEKELVAHFNSKFCLHHIIPTPKFKFGGTTGSVVTSLVLQKTSPVSQNLCK